MFNDNDFELEEDIQGVNHIRLDIGSMETKSLTYLCNNLQLNTQMLAGIIRHQTPSIIHAASGYKGYELAVMAKALSDHFSLPWIYEVRSFHEHTWTNDDFQAKTSSHTKQRMVRENSLMQKADHIVTISESMKAAIIERGIDAEKITVVPNAVDCEKFKPKRKKARLLRTHGLRKKKVLGYISNMSRREGHEILIKAMPAIIENHPDAMLLLVGDGRERPALEKLTSECGVVDHVIFTGNVDHGLITDYYAIIDLFIVPRRRDYAADLVTPLKPYEAMAMKIPLLVSDRPALKEIIGDDRGFSFETENIEDLAGAVDECLSNPSECSKRSRHAHSWLLENRTWDLNAEVYKDLYRRVLDGYGAEIIDE
jgi:glycosyltransferase involved in cell wall biosynthesis